MYIGGANGLLRMCIYTEFHLFSLCLYLKETKPFPNQTFMVSR